MPSEISHPPSSSKKMSDWRLLGMIFFPLIFGVLGLILLRAVNQDKMEAGFAFGFFIGILISIKLAPTLPIRIVTGVICGMAFLVMMVIVSSSGSPSTGSTSSSSALSTIRTPTVARDLIIQEMQHQYGMFKDQYSIECLFDNHRGTVILVRLTDPKYQQPGFRKFFTFVLERDQANSDYYISNYNVITAVNPPTPQDIESTLIRFK